MASGQARMIQMLATLSGIQQQRRAQDLDEQKFQESTQEFAAQMGFNKDQKQYKVISDLVDAIAKSSTESRNSLVELGRTLGLPQDQVQALAAFGQSAPESMQIMQQRDAAKGMSARTPATAQAQQAEAASIASTGMPSGQAATSGLTANLATGGQSPIPGMTGPATSQVAQAFIQRLASGQSGLEYAASQAGAQNPNLVTQRAGIEGGNISPEQAAQNEIARVQAQASLGGVSADFYRTNASILANAGDIAAKLATAKSLGGLTPENIIQGVSGLREIIMAIGKEKSSTNRMYLMSQYNQLARTINPALMISDQNQLPDKASILDRMESAVNQPGMTGQPVGGTNPPGITPNAMTPWIQPGMMNTPQPTYMQPQPIPFRRP